MKYEPFLWFFSWFLNQFGLWLGTMAIYVRKYVAYYLHMVIVYSSQLTQGPMQVPLLLVLILLSIIPTLPACVYMFVAQYHMDSYQLALQWPQLAFLLASIGFGSYAVRPLLFTVTMNSWYHGEHS